MLNLSKNHKNLVLTSFWGYLILSSFVSIIPAIQMQNIKPLPGQKDLTTEERDGLKTFVAEDCMACHTQQVRNIEMDKMWGNRPSIPSDYYYSKKRIDVWRQSPSFLGSERTGPDLTNIGARQPSDDWHLIHLYNPRLVVKESVMPSYKWLFMEKDSTQITADDVVLNVPPEQLKNKNSKVVATQKAINLVAFLKYLKQPELPGEAPVEFIPAKAKPTTADSGGGGSDLPDGEKLYMNTCAVCHQADGKGLPGAFPSLSDSPVVNDENFRLHAAIILMGYDSRPEYAVMQPFADQLSDAEIAAIINHERTNWGNQSKTVTAEEVKAVRDSLIK
ncbi:MAG: cbb3-type cytochrome c oxidase subunit II [Weeksellaceae bacterium]|jgi:cytochrome c oxidase cbb3-type subunit 2|nr:cbb3-type cytochrome c oxidase subunit II [Weeksellaceae bacterium]